MCSDLALPLHIHPTGSLHIAEGAQTGGSHQRQGTSKLPPPWDYRQSCMDIGAEVRAGCAVRRCVRCTCTLTYRRNRLALFEEGLAVSALGQDNGCLGALRSLLPHPQPHQSITHIIVVRAACIAVEWRGLMCIGVGLTTFLQPPAILVVCAPAEL